MTKVRFSRTYASPTGTWIGDDIADLEPEFADSLIRAGIVVEIVEKVAGVVSNEIVVPMTSAERRVEFLETIEDADVLKGILDVGGVEYGKQRLPGLRKLIAANPLALALVDDPAAPVSTDVLDELTDEQLIEKAILSGVDLAELGENPDRTSIIAKLTEIAGPGSTDAENTGTETEDPATGTEATKTASTGAPRKR